MGRSRPGVSHSDNPILPMGKIERSSPASVVQDFIIYRSGNHHCVSAMRRLKSICLVG
jgi:hypothetical protein